MRMRLMVDSEHESERLFFLCAHNMNRLYEIWCAYLILIALKQMHCLFVWMCVTFDAFNEIINFVWYIILCPSYSELSLFYEVPQYILEEKKNNLGCSVNLFSVHTKLMLWILIFIADWSDWCVKNEHERFITQWFLSLHHVAEED